MYKYSYYSGFVFFIFLLLTLTTLGLGDSNNAYAVCKKHILIGDLHGNISGLRDYLVDAEFLNDDLSFKFPPPKETCLVFVGDYIDRDPYSLEVYQLISELQTYINVTTSANTNGSKVIRLIGNHEMLVLHGNSYSKMMSKRNGGNTWMYYKGDDTFDLFKLRMQTDLKNDNLTSAYYFEYTDIKGEKKQVVVTHAGISEDICKEYQRNNKDNIVNPSKLVDWINSKVKIDLTSKEAQEENSIYDLSFIPNNEYFSKVGIFWNRNRFSPFCKGFDQVRGHDKQTDISYHLNGNTIYYIDIGTAKKIYNGRAYLQFEDLTDPVAKKLLARNFTLNYFKSKKLCNACFSIPQNKDKDNCRYNRSSLNISAILIKLQKFIGI
ncbi:MAG: metallophosphoesterase [Oligoflexia bacterium]|nr:metallophosphoesterase [Oligoflexia bacterium]